MMFNGLYPTELSLEAFYPHYVDPQFTHLKPSIFTVESMKKMVSYNETVRPYEILPILLAEANPQMHAENSANAGDRDFNFEQTIKMLSWQKSFETESFPPEDRM
ncbi:unnamed protein product [Sphenostylis stenocarpa]|uniref:Uncharacterized protein n=1 Tax=Sphenostylis stenocarpa TaxID=92480 RepID=A0AA87B8F6_9FABA|nr:unnamed protein product [Sphenostylis stenocarpa]